LPMMVICSMRVVGHNKIGCVFSICISHHAGSCIRSRMRCHADVLLYASSLVAFISFFLPEKMGVLPTEPMHFVNYLLKMPICGSNVIQ